MHEQTAHKVVYKKVIIYDLCFTALAQLLADGLVIFLWYLWSNDCRGRRQKASTLCSPVDFKQTWLSFDVCLGHCPAGKYILSSSDLI